MKTANSSENALDREELSFASLILSVILVAVIVSSLSFLAVFLARMGTSVLVEASSAVMLATDPRAADPGSPSALLACIALLLSVEAIVAYLVCRASRTLFRWNAARKNRYNGDDATRRVISPSGGFSGDLVPRTIEGTPEGVTLDESASPVR